MKPVYVLLPLFAWAFLAWQQHLPQTQTQLTRQQPISLADTLMSKHVTFSGLNAAGEWAFTYTNARQQHIHFFLPPLEAEAGMPEPDSRWRLSGAAYCQAIRGDQLYFCVENPAELSAL